MAVDEGRKNSTIHELYPALITRCGVPYTNGLIALPGALNVKSFLVFLPTAETYIPRHVVLKVDRLLV